MSLQRAKEHIKNAMASANEAEQLAKLGNDRRAYVANEWALYLLTLAREELVAVGCPDSEDVESALARIELIESEIAH